MQLSSLSLSESGSSSSQATRLSDEWKEVRVRVVFALTATRLEWQPQEPPASGPQACGQRAQALTQALSDRLQVLLGLVSHAGRPAGTSGAGPGPWE